MSKLHKPGTGGGATELTTYGYSERDELLSESSTLTGVTTLGYDANGSLTSSVSPPPAASPSSPGVVTTYGYDERNKLVSVRVGSATVATYTYDAGDNRISETVGGVTTGYLNDALNPSGYTQPVETKVGVAIGTVTAVGAVMMTYILGDRVLGQVPASSASQAKYLLTDGHGSTRALSSATGGVAEQYAYDAFGRALGFDASAAGTAYLFGGDATYDGGSGMYLHGNGVRERRGFVFTQRDTFAGYSNDPTSLHKFLYVGSNPVNAADPSGHFVDLLVSAAVEAGEVAQEVGKAAGAVGLAMFVAGLATYYGASVGLAICSSTGNSAGMDYFATLQDQSVQAMRASGILMAGGALAYLAGTVMIGGAMALKAMGDQPSSGNVANIGNKLEYLFGNATGSQHNIDRSQGMARELGRIGLVDSPSTRQYLASYLNNVMQNPNNIISDQGGRVVKESLLAGPGGFIKMQTVWEGSKLITVKLFS